MHVCRFTSRRPDVGLDLSAGIVQHIAKDHPGTFTCKELGFSGALATGTTADQSNFAIESTHAVLFSGKTLLYGAALRCIIRSSGRESCGIFRVRGEEDVTAVSDLEAFVRPRSIAVVGASERTDAWGHWLFRKLLDEGFPGRLYPINRQAQTILGQPAYAQVSAVPGPVDLAIIAIPAPYIFETIRDCAVKGVKAGLIITAGFSEARQDGRAQEQEMVAYARAHGMRLVGPNVSGIINLHYPLLAHLQNAPTCTRHR